MSFREGLARKGVPTGDNWAMRAIVQAEFGGPDVLQLTEVAQPIPIPTEVLVRVVAAGVNPVDWKTRSGGGMAPVLGPPPFTVGWDVSGVVEEVGRGVNRFKPGDEVCGMPWFPRQAAAYAEFVTAPSRQLARKPSQLDHLTAAALPLAGLTARQVLVDVAHLSPGQKVLIHAGGGGVGHLAVQLARALGALVTATASADRHELVRSLGADRVIDYTSSRFEDQLEGMDLVVDLVGGDIGRRSLDVLAPGGLLVSVPSGSDPSLQQAAAGRGLRATGFLVEPDGAGVEELLRSIERGELKVELEATYPLAQAAEAHRAGEAGHRRGKLVLRVDQ